MKKVKCIVCKKDLEEFDTPKENSFHPMDGLEFITYGHYGSTIFDPVVEVKRLRVCICDKCVAQGIEDKLVLGDIDEASYDHIEVDKAN